jgi:serine phosphatase RsbU (regulator of sigma subunit)
MELNAGQLTLGRALDNDLSYPEDFGLSRHHLVLQRVGGQWLVRDLDSKNGTLLNGEKVSGARQLRAGDRIAASRIVLAWDEPGPAPAATVIFEAPASSESPPTHTVSLDQLLPKEAAPDTHPGRLGPDWSDPVSVLVRAGRRLMARRGLPHLYEDTLSLSMEAVGATRGVLLLEEGAGLKTAASRGEEFHISTAVRDRVLERRTSLLVSDAMLDEALRLRQSIVRQQVHSLMAVPLQTEDRVLGLVYVDSPHLWRAFTPHDLNLLTVIANLAALRIERERLAVMEAQQRAMEVELERAAEIQRQILPAAFPAVEGLELAGHNAPCHTVGGDYYDFLERPDGRIVVAVADVAGKGMSAALLMVNLQARVEMLAEHHAGPAEMVAHLNRAMSAVCPGNRFVTLFLCQIDPATGECAYTNAGHNPPLTVRASGRVDWLKGGGPVLGILSGVTYEQRVLRLEPGQAIIIYSDGVTEATNAAGEEFGEERLVEAVRGASGLTAGDLVARLRQAVEEFAAGSASPDDLTLVAARWVPPQESPIRA